MPPPPSSTRDFAIAAINLEDTLHSIKLHLEKILNAIIQWVYVIKKAPFF